MGTVSQERAQDFRNAKKALGDNPKKEIMMDRFKKVGLFVAGGIAIKFVYDFIDAGKMADDLRIKLKEKLEDNGRRNFPSV